MRERRRQAESPHGHTAQIPGDALDDEDRRPAPDRLRADRTGRIRHGGGGVRRARRRGRDRGLAEDRLPARRRGVELHPARRLDVHGDDEVGRGTVLRPLQRHVPAVAEAERPGMEGHLAPRQGDRRLDHGHGRRRRVGVQERQRPDGVPLGRNRLDGELPGHGALLHEGQQGALARRRVGGRHLQGHDLAVGARRRALRRPGLEHRQAAGLHADGHAQHHERERGRRHLGGRFQGQGHHHRRRLPALRGALERHPVDRVGAALVQPRQHPALRRRGQEPERRLARRQPVQPPGRHQGRQDRRLRPPLGRQHLEADRRAGQGHPLSLLLRVPRRPALGRSGVQHQQGRGPLDRHVLGVRQRPQRHPVQGRPTVRLTGRVPVHERLLDPRPARLAVPAVT
ncbi:hypothetical protein SGPA1_10016 [Streptomyces misionensis JCM 4497]